MNRAIALPLILSLLGCTAARSTNQPQSATDEAAIRVVEEQGRSGVLNRDTSVLRRVWSEQLMVNSPSNQISPHRGIILDLLRQGLIHYSASSAGSSSFVSTATSRSSWVKRRFNPPGVPRKQARRCSAASPTSGRKRGSVAPDRTAREHHSASMTLPAHLAASRQWSGHDEQLSVLRGSERKGDQEILGKVIDPPNAARSRRAGHVGFRIPTMCSRGSRLNVQSSGRSRQGSCDEALVAS